MTGRQWASGLREENLLCANYPQSFSFSTDRRRDTKRFTGEMTSKRRARCCAGARTGAKPRGREKKQQSRPQRHHAETWRRTKLDVGAMSLSRQHTEASPADRAHGPHVRITSAALAAAMPMKLDPSLKIQRNVSLRNRRPEMANEDAIYCVYSGRTIDQSIRIFVYIGRQFFLGDRL